MEWYIAIPQNQEYEIYIILSLKWYALTIY